MRRTCGEKQMFTEFGAAVLELFCLLLVMQVKHSIKVFLYVFFVSNVFKNYLTQQLFLFS